MVSNREKGSEPGEDADRFSHDTICANYGVQHWVELDKKPAPGTNVTKAITLVKFATGLICFPYTCHGGALFPLTDEAMCSVVVANTVLEHGAAFMKAGEEQWRLQIFNNKSAQKVLKGHLVTAGMDVKVLAPVLCPVVVGIGTDVIEDRGNKTKIRATMRDRQGKSVVQAEASCVKVEGAAKL